MSEEIQVIDLAPVDASLGTESKEPAQLPEEDAPPWSRGPNEMPPPPLERQESVLAPVPEEAEAPKPNRRGRPPGSRNRPKAKPPPPPEVLEEEDTPRPPSRRVQMQAPYHEGQNLEMAQSLLDLMHGMAASKQNRRRQLYQSWF